MVWVASSLTDVIAVEGYYQYKWKPVVLPPVGTVFSVLDLYGGDGVQGHGAFLGGGQVSDLGTDLDAQFALPPGTLGFDPQFDRIPGRTVDKPSDGGQYGVSLFARFLDGLATKLAVHYIRYNTRLPIISGRTADAAAIAATSAASVDALAGRLTPDLYRHRPRSRGRRDNRDADGGVLDAEPVHERGRLLRRVPGARRRARRFVQLLRARHRYAGIR